MKTIGFTSPYFYDSKVQDLNTKLEVLTWIESQYPICHMGKSEDGTFPEAYYNDGGIKNLRVMPSGKSISFFMIEGNIEQVEELLALRPAPGRRGSWSARRPQSGHGRFDPLDLELQGDVRLLGFGQIAGACHRFQSRRHLRSHGCSKAPHRPFQGARMALHESRIAALGGVAWNLFGAVQFAGSVTATPESLVASGLTPEQAAMLVAQILGRSDLLSVETSTFNNASAYLVKFTNGDQAYVRARAGSRSSASCAGRCWTGWRRAWCSGTTAVGRCSPTGRPRADACDLTRT